jgi:uncharacterized Ntn-hydrolase superfamily protein
MKCPLKIFILSVLLFWTNLSFAQDTFSIVAIDTVDGLVGSAAASFVGGVSKFLISKVFYVLPGVGAIHTQAWYEDGNYLNAKQWMKEGESPQAIIDSLVANDVGNSPYLRQYIVIDLVNGGRTAGYTGHGCDAYKNHVLGKGYAIAGNCLYGQAVLDSMEAGFSRTTGTLADKLMAALMGGKSAGGDKRGKQYHLSSLMAVLKVAKPGNPASLLYLNLLVAYPPILPGWKAPTRDPVDSLQSLYNKWKNPPSPDTNSVYDLQKQDYVYHLYQNYPNPFNPTTTIHFSLARRQKVSLKVYDLSGNEVATLIHNEFKATGDYSAEFHAGHLASGVYVYRLLAEDFTQTRKMILIK